MRKTQDMVTVERRDVPFLRILSVFETFLEGILKDVTGVCDSS